MPTILFLQTLRYSFIPCHTLSSHTVPSCPALSCYVKLILLCTTLIWRIYPNIHETFLLTFLLCSLLLALCTYDCIVVNRIVLITNDITLPSLTSAQMGIIAISAVDQLPKIKIYRDGNGDCKGDCALCYNAEGSLAMALEVLHEGYIRPGYQITVKKAEFVASGEASNDDGTGTGTQTLIPNQNQNQNQNQFKPSRPKLSQAQVKVAKSAMRQALTWNEDDDMGLSKSKALKIIVIEGSCVLSHSIML